MIDAEAKIEKLRAALAFYGDEANYRYRPLPPPPSGMDDPLILDDGGDRARMALEETE